METEISVKKKVEITRGDFEDYENVRKTGLTNMFCINQVVELSYNLTKEKVKSITINYKELLREFPSVRPEIMKDEILENLKS